MPDNLEFLDLLKRMEIIHQKKNEDYSSGRPDENFERVAEIQKWFNNPLDKPFAGFVAVKLARLGVLLSGTKEPNNESVEDSFLDLCTYCALWAASSKRRSKQNYYAIPAAEHTHDGAYRPEYLEISRGNLGYYSETPNEPTKTPEAKKREEILKIVDCIYNDATLARILSECRRYDVRLKDARIKDASAPRKD